MVVVAVTAVWWVCACALCSVCRVYGSRRATIPVRPGNRVSPITHDVTHESMNSWTNHCCQLPTANLPLTTTNNTRYLVPPQPTPHCPHTHHTSYIKMTIILSQLLLLLPSSDTHSKSGLVVNDPLGFNLVAEGSLHHHQNDPNQQHDPYYCYGTYTNLLQLTRQLYHDKDGNPSTSWWPCNGEITVPYGGSNYNNNNKTIRMNDAWWNRPVKVDDSKLSNCDGNSAEVPVVVIIVASDC